MMKVGGFSKLSKKTFSKNQDFFYFLTLFGKNTVELMAKIAQSKGVEMREDQMSKLDRGLVTFSAVGAGVGWPNPPRF